MKKLLILILSALMTVCVCTACSTGNGGESSSSSSSQQSQTYKVTFRQANEEDVVKTVTAGGALAATDIPAVQPKTGYNVEWDLTDVNLNNITESIIIEAKITPKTYTVTLDADGGTVASATVEVTYDAVPTLPTPTRTDYTFTGWTYDNKAVTGKWDIDAENITLKATWQEVTKRTVTFNQNGQEPIVKEVVDGTALTDIPTPVAKTGYTVVWDITDFSNITENVVVTAVETAKTYTITLTTQYGTLASTTMTVTYDGVYTLPDLPDIGDMVFKGWKYGNTTLPMTGNWNIDAESITLVADWDDDGENWTANY